LRIFLVIETKRGLGAKPPSAGARGSKGGAPSAWWFLGFATK